MTARQNINPGYVHDALICLHEKGIDPAPILAAAGLPPEVRAPVSHTQYGRLWWLIAENTRDELFGLGAHPMRPGSYSLMCYAILHAGNLERALRRAIKFLNVVMDDPTGHLHVQNGEAVLELRDSGPPRRAFAYRAYWILLMGVACWLIGRRIPLRRLGFACPEPDSSADYRQFFGAPVRFDQATTTLVFDAAYLGLPIKRSDLALIGFLRATPANVLVRYHQDRQTTARVRAILTHLPPTEWPDFDEIAARLSCSTATLRRRLKSDGQSYGEIKTELRMTQAERLLAASRLGMSEIASELGYSEPSAFHRAFVKWSGKSPGAFREGISQLVQGQPTAAPPPNSW